MPWVPGTRRAGWVVTLWSLVSVANADGTPSAQKLSSRQLAEAGGDGVMLAQHSLLLQVKNQLDDPLESLATWVPELGPCDEGANSFLDGWKFVKCDGNRATEL